MTQAVAALRDFAHHHDELPAFHAGYLILVLLFAALFSMGAFGVLILAHMSLDVVKYREVHGYTWRGVVAGTFHESLIDLALLTVGFTFAVYLHHSVVGIASLSGFMRAEVTVIRSLGMLIPKLKILHHFLKVVTNLYEYLQSVHPQMEKGLSTLERVSLFALLTSLLLLVLSPMLLQIDLVQLQGILLEELIPWKL